jgi:hypothetical protein
MKQEKQAKKVALNESIAGSIDLTKKDFDTLAKMVYLGEWMINAHRTGLPGDLVHTKFRDMQIRIMKLAPKFGFDKKYEHNLDFAPEGMDTEVEQFRNEFEEETFWNELTERMVDKELEQKYSKHNMTFDEFMDKQIEIEEKINRILETDGTDALMLIDLKNIKNK